MVVALFHNLKIAALFAFLLLNISHPSASGADTNAAIEFSKLGDGVYAYIASPDSNAVSNSGVVILPHSVLVFDTHFTPEAGQALLAGIQAISSVPVRYIVNSHFHPDHTHGNQAFYRTQHIIASTNARRDILQKDQPAMNRMLAAAQSQIDQMRRDLLKADTLKESMRSQISTRQAFLDRMAKQKIVPPQITVEDTLSIQDEGMEVRLISAGLGHTNGDLVLFLPGAKIAFLGDLFFNASFPNVQDASLLQWMKTLNEIIALDADKFVPGHGPVGSKKDVENFRVYLEDLRALVEPAITRGDAMDQVVRDTPIPAKYAAYGFSNFFAANVQKMYTELKALKLATTTVTDPEAAKKPPADKY